MLLLFTEQIVAIHWTRGLKQTRHTADKNNIFIKTIDDGTNPESDRQCA